MKKRYWLGLGKYADGGALIRVVFTAAETPTRASHGELFAACVGPFRTKRGAVFMRDFGRDNPHCRCVDEAETLAKLYSNR